MPVQFTPWPDDDGDPDDMRYGVPCLICHATMTPAGDPLCPDCAASQAG